MNTPTAMVQLAFIFVLSFGFGSAQVEQEVNLEQGRIHGTTMTTRNGRNIWAYLGIPYAKPPVGPLRFKSPERADEWSGVLSGDTDGNQCPQFNDDGILVGDEDCLYLNVYSPEFDETLDHIDDQPTIYPTMVYFHGGNFVKGSGSSTDAGPEYLMDKDIVLVTVNYRLDVLGFLSTGDAQAPGNFGLKDQVLALKWVQENIIGFRGDPHSVTIFGQDAGGVSTSLHALSDASKGLFHRYISQSGSAMCIWGFEDMFLYKKRATDLGKYLNCSTDNSRVLIDCLRNQDAYDLVDSNDIFNDLIWQIRTWGPTDEPEQLEGGFFTKHPITLIYFDSDIEMYPAMIGNVIDEGLVFTAELYANDTKYETIAKDPSAFINFIMTMFLNEDNPEQFNRWVQIFYFNGTDPTDKESFTQNMTNFISDAAFRYPAHSQANILSSLDEGSGKYPFYTYTFDYRGTYSKTSAVTGNNENIGVTHGDDLIYLFPMRNSDFQMSESDEKMIDIMVDFWTSFAETGTPISKSISDLNVWKPYDGETKIYLKIGGNSDPMEIQGYSVAHDIRLNAWFALVAQSVYEFLLDGLGRR